MAAWIRVYLQSDCRCYKGAYKKYIEALKVVEMEFPHSNCPQEFRGAIQHGPKSSHCKRYTFVYLNGATL